MVHNLATSSLEPFSCAPQLTGADLYALCADSWMEALKRRIRALEGFKAGAVHMGEGSGRAFDHAVGASGEDLEDNLYRDDQDNIHNDSHHRRALPLSHQPLPTPGQGDGTSYDQKDLPSLGVHGGPIKQPDEAVAVRQEDFLTALRNLVPSLSAEEVQKYERLRDHYQGGK